jgi:hypothetical protein
VRGIAFFGFLGEIWFGSAAKCLLLAKSRTKVVITASIGLVPGDSDAADTGSMMLAR